MADGEHTHGGRSLTLDDVQMIIGRAMVDEKFRAAFTENPKNTLKKLHISLNTGSPDDQKSRDLVDALAAALGADQGGASLQETLKTLRDSYLASSDGVIRPHCA